MCTKQRVLSYSNCCCSSHYIGSLHSPSFFIRHIAETNQTRLNCVAYRRKMDAEYSKGQRLLVETDVGTLEGIFYSMNPGRTRLTLTEVILQSGKKVEGFSHYYKNEIISVLAPDSSAGVSAESEASGNGKDQQAVQPDSNAGVSTESEASGNGKDQQAVQPDRTELSEEEVDALNKLVANHVLIDSVGDIFRKAVEDIKAEPAVGFSVEGALLGRSNEASLVSLATPSCAFLFDIYTLGDAAFDNGLRDILESEEIEKVIHNCRLVSDCLYHRHKVTICNIFDTQVADLKVTQQKCGEFPRCVRSLPECLSIYLNLPENLIYRPQIRDGYIVSDLQKWNSRPLPVELEIGAVKNLVSLLQLREKVCEELLRPFYHLCDVFMEFVRDSPQPESSEHLDDEAKVLLEELSLDDEPDNDATVPLELSLNDEPLELLSLNDEP